MLISFEGGEGAGKSIQADLLAKALIKLQYEVLKTREPGGCVISEEVREIFKDPDNASITPITELFLIEASRAQLMQEVIRPALLGGKIVICDRFVDSTVVYQGLVGGVDPWFVKNANNIATGGVRPDITFYLKVGIETVMNRVQARAKYINTDRLDDRGVEMHEAISRKFDFLANMEPQRIVVIDGEQGMETISEEILKIVLGKLKK